jgi:hypothetical protein
MKLITILVALAHTVNLVDAGIKMDGTVFCTRIGGPRRGFRVCATAMYEWPQVGDTSPHVFTYQIIQGVPEGTDAYSLPPEDLAVAQLNGITVEVTGLDDTCSVKVTVKGQTAQCQSCSYCDPDPNTAEPVKEWFIADCTNIPNGRKTRCESGALDTFMFAPYTGGDPVSALENAEVFFPLLKQALPAPPTPAPTKQPRMMMFIPV